MVRFREEGNVQVFISTNKFNIGNCGILKGVNRDWGWGIGRAGLLEE